MASSKAIAVGNQKKKASVSNSVVQPVQASNSNKIAADSDDESSTDTTESSSDDDNLPANSKIGLPHINGKSVTFKPINEQNGISRSTKPKSSSGSSSNETSNEEDSKEEEGSENQDATDSGSSVGSEDESVEESENSGEDKDQKANTTVPGRQPPKEIHKSSTDKPNLPQEPSLYTPPSGFRPISVERNEISRTSELFKKTALDGKQIWHIVAPASVPLETLKQVSLQDISKGKAVLSFNGDKYGFVNDSGENGNSTRIIVPKESSDYKTDGRLVDRVLRLQQVVELPILHDASSLQKDPRATVSTPKPIRKQPKGLKMRFLPIGFGLGNPGTLGLDSPSAESGSAESDSDEEMRDIPNQPLSTSKIRPDPIPLSESSDEESSNSDVEMTESPPTRPKSILPPKLANTTESDKLTSKSPSHRNFTSQNTPDKHKSNTPIIPTPILPPFTASSKSKKLQSGPNQVTSSPSIAQGQNQTPIRPPKRKDIDGGNAKAKSNKLEKPPKKHKESVNGH